jgi:hypothetical protein
MLGDYDLHNFLYHSSIWKHQELEIHNNYCHYLSKHPFFFMKDKLH